MKRVIGQMKQIGLDHGSKPEGSKGVGRSWGSLRRRTKWTLTAAFRKIGTGAHPPSFVRIQPVGDQTEAVGEFLGEAGQPLRTSCEESEP